MSERGERAPGTGSPGAARSSSPPLVSLRPQLTVRCRTCPWRSRCRSTSRTTTAWTSPCPPPPPPPASWAVPWLPARHRRWAPGIPTSTWSAWRGPGPASAARTGPRARRGTRGSAGAWRAPRSATWRCSAGAAGRRQRTRTEGTRTGGAPRPTQQPKRGALPLSALIQSVAPCQLTCRK